MKIQKFLKSKTWLFSEKFLIQDKVLTEVLVFYPSARKEIIEFYVKTLAIKMGQGAVGIGPSW